MKDRVDRNNRLHVAQPITTEEVIAAATNLAPSIDFKIILRYLEEQRAKRYDQTIFCDIKSGENLEVARGRAQELTTLVKLMKG